MLDLIRTLLVMGLVGWLMWWVISPPSRAVGQWRALVLTVVIILVSCIGG